MPDDESATQATTEPEDEQDYRAYVGAPLDPDYLAHLSQEEDT